MASSTASDSTTPVGVLRASISATAIRITRRSITGMRSIDQPVARPAISSSARSRLASAAVSSSTANGAGATGRVASSSLAVIWRWLAS